MTIYMSIVLHARSNGRFIEIEHNAGRKKLDILQGSNFFNGSFRDKGYVRAPV